VCACSHSGSGRETVAPPPRCSHREVVGVPWRPVGEQLARCLWRCVRTCSRAMSRPSRTTIELRRGASGRLLTAILGLARRLRTKVEGECGPEGSPGGLWGTSCPGEGLRRAHLRLLLLLPAEGCEFQDWREVVGACAPGREGDVRHRQVAGPLAAQCYTDSLDGRIDTEHQCVDILDCCRAALCWIPCFVPCECQVAGRGVRIVRVVSSTCSQKAQTRLCRCFVLARGGFQPGVRPESERDHCLGTWLVLRPTRLL